MKFLLLLVVLLFGVALFAAGEKQKTPPNIVFFLVDDLGWSDIGCYGSSFYETPNIDKLAEDGVRFNQAYAACHVCSPTRASILTGKYPARLHLTDWLAGRKNYPFQKLKMPKHVQHLADGEKTLADAFKLNGYSTAIFGKWHVGEEPSGPTSKGFDVQIPQNWNKGWPKAGYHAPFGMDGINGKKGDYLTDRLTDEALNYIEKNKDKPFFLYFSHFAVHDPIQGRKDLVEKYKKKLASMPKPKGPAFILEGNPDSKKPLSRKELDGLIKKPSHKGYKVLPQQTVKIKQHQDNVEFAAMVESVDESLGRVVARLKELGLSDNTIIIFFSDNGGMSGANFARPSKNISKSQLDKSFASSNLPLRGAKGWLYEGGIRVPMIVKWPGVGKKGLICEEPVTSTDFYPSLLEMAGLPAMPEQHMDGVSFVPALKGEAFERKAIYWHFPHYSNHGMQSPGGAIRLGDYKLLEYFENNTVQLFNLKDDLGEQNDLSKTQPEKVRALLNMLHAWRKEVSAQMTTSISAKKK